MKRDRAARRCPTRTPRCRAGARGAHAEQQDLAGTRQVVEAGISIRCRAARARAFRPRRVHPRRRRRTAPARDRCAVEFLPEAAHEAEAIAPDALARRPVAIGRAQPFAGAGARQCPSGSRSSASPAIVDAVAARHQRQPVLAGICGKPRKLSWLANFSRQVAKRLSQPASSRIASPGAGVAPGAAQSSTWRASSRLSSRLTSPTEAGRRAVQKPHPPGGEPAGRMGQAAAGQEGAAFFDGRDLARRRSPEKRGRSRRRCRPEPPGRARRRRGRRCVTRGSLSPRNSTRNAPPARVISPSVPRNRSCRRRAIGPVDLPDAQFGRVVATGQDVGFGQAGC
jgi:hypothetical protein